MGERSEEVTKFLFQLGRILYGVQEFTYTIFRRSEPERTWAAVLPEGGWLYAEVGMGGFNYRLVITARDRDKAKLYELAQTSGAAILIPFADGRRSIDINVLTALIG